MKRVLLIAVCAGALLSGNFALAQQAADGQPVATVKAKKKPSAAENSAGALLSVPLAVSPLLIALAKKNHGHQGHHDHPKSDDGAGCHKHETGGCEHDGDGDNDNGGGHHHDHGGGQGDGDHHGGGGGHNDKP